MALFVPRTELRMGRVPPPRLNLPLGRDGQRPSAAATETTAAFPCRDVARPFVGRLPRLTSARAGRGISFDGRHAHRRKLTALLKFLVSCPPLAQLSPRPRPEQTGPGDVPRKASS